MKAKNAEVAPGIWADGRRAVFIEPLRALVVADLHWGYVTTHRAGGNLLPAWGDAEIAERLGSLIADYGPREMIWVGDCLHSVEGRHAAETFLQHSDPALTTHVLAGNHDRRWSRASRTPLVRERFFFHHGDLAAPRSGPDLIEVVGHYHPAVVWSDGAGARLRVPGLVVSPQRLILPAFSPWAAGVPWNSQLRAGESLWALAPSRIFAVRCPAPTGNPSK
jgi:metallophosphoesterase superfamily enzyme